MSFKDVLLSLTAYPEPTPVAAVDQAVALADIMGARIAAIACAVKIQTPGRIALLSDALLEIPAIVAAAEEKSANAARDLIAAFESAAQKRGNFQEKIVERCLPSEVPDLLVQYARLRDLTLIPLPEGDYVDQWYAESVIFGSGRPVMVIPAAPRRAPALDTVAVAWDFSRPAARAVWDALPILEKAKVVRAVTVTSEKVIDSTRSAEELAKHLARHGVSVVLDKYDAQGRTIGEALEAYVAAQGADLLVMGAYGHSRLREFVLGGATKSMLGRPPLPVLLSH
jgi:nucleotide-binding universal stress UspA family protein